MNLVKQKAEMWYNATGQKMGWFKVWQNIILLIILIFASINLLSVPFSLFSAGGFLSIFTTIQCVIQFALALLAFIYTRKCNAMSFNLNFAFIAWCILNSLSGLFLIESTKATISAEVEKALLASPNLDAQTLSYMQSFTEMMGMMTSVIMIIQSIVMVVLYSLNLVYFIKRKAVYEKSVDEIQAMLDINSQY